MDKEKKALPECFLRVTMNKIFNSRLTPNEVVDLVFLRATPLIIIILKSMGEYFESMGTIFAYIELIINTGLTDSLQVEKRHVSRVSLL